MSHKFIHLRNHTNYSLLEGMLKIDTIADLCTKYNMPATAITDTNNMFGILDFSKTMMDKGIQPIIGTQINISINQLYGNLVLLAVNQNGYHNLIKLSSKSYLESSSKYTNSLTLEQLSGLTNGIICLVGGLDGLISKLITNYHGKCHIESIISQLKLLFPNKLYIEIQRHNVELEQKLEPLLLSIAQNFILPIVATNECIFPHKNQEEAAKILAFIRNNSFDTQNLNITSNHYFKSQEEMIELFKDLPDAITNTIKIAQCCSAYVPLKNPMLPKFSKNETKELIEQAQYGLKLRLKKEIYTDKTPEKEKAEIENTYFQRLKYELEIINKMNFAGYFLIVADFIQWAKNHKIPVGPGRGSGAGSLVAWALLITEINPIKFGLIFERFLNPDRISIPDFDVDFCPEYRDKVIEYASNKYGPDYIAQIVTFGTLQPRAAVRDVGRALGITYKAVDRICKMMPNNPSHPITIAEIIDYEPLISKAMQEDDQIEKLMIIAQQLEGLYRHASIHAAGIIIADKPLQEITPLYKDKDANIIATQFNMKSTELAGLVKFDFLGLKTLTIINKTIQLIGKNIDINNISISDQYVYEKIFYTGLTGGIFQFEGYGMTNATKQIKPNQIEEIIAILALYRPGPMDNIPAYIDVKFGRKKKESLHPLINHIIDETYGIIIYQEQVMEIACQFAGYTLSQADLLRRAMGKKIKSVMNEQENVFIMGAKNKGIDVKTAEKVFKFIEKFAEYGFNKSHSTAYAIIAYQTAWLKAYYPCEFITAFLHIDIQNTHKLILFKNEMSQLGIKLLPPNINKSQINFSIESLENNQKAIRCGFLSIRGVGHDIAEKIIFEREKNGLFNNISDFSKRITNLKKNHILPLIVSGIFDSIFPNRGKLYNGYELIIKNSEHIKSNTLFSFAEGINNLDNQLNNQLNWTIEEQSIKEIASLGLYMSDHPFAKFNSIVEQIGLTSLKKLKECNSSKKAIFIAGIVLSIEFKRTSKSGNRYIFIKLYDFDQTVELTSWDSEKNNAITVGSIVSFIVEKTNKHISIVRFFSYEEYLLSKNNLLIKINHENTLKIISKLFTSSEEGLVLVNINYKNTKFNLQEKIKPTVNLIEKLIEIPNIEFLLK